MLVGDRIREARRRVGWTQAQLANAMGVNKSAVAHWETDRGGITADNLQAAARVLGIPIGELMEDDAPAADEGMRVRDPKEIALVSLWRQLTPEQQDAHLHLFYASAAVSQLVQTQSHPSDRRRIRS